MRKSVHDELVRFNRPAIHFAKVVHNENSLPRYFEAVRRLIELHPNAPCSRRFQAFMISVVTAKDSKQGNVSLVEWLERKWRAVVSRVHDERHTSLEHLLNQPGDCRNPVMGISEQSYFHSGTLHSGSSLSLRT